MKLRKILCVVLCLVFLIGAFAITSFATVIQEGTKPSGSGTESDPYLISTGDELWWLCYENYYNDLDVFYAKLVNDIVISNVTWYPISWYESDSFQGTLYGEKNEDGTPKYHIEYWTKANDWFNYNEVGLFGHAKNATFKDIEIRTNGSNYNDLHENLCGNSDIGTLVGYCENCTFDNVVVKSARIESQSGYTGGICGRAYNSTFNNCSFEGVFKTSGSYIGGICGYSEGCTFDNCNANVYLIRRFDWISGAYGNNQDFYHIKYMGGIAGYIYNGKIENCTAAWAGNVCDGDDKGLGGIAGWADNADITNCKVSSEIYEEKPDYVYTLHSGKYTGGICGYFDTNKDNKIKNCEAKIDVFCDNSKYGQAIAGYVSDSSCIEGCKYEGTLNNKKSTYVGTAFTAFEGSNIFTIIIVAVLAAAVSCVVTIIVMKKKATKA